MGVVYLARDVALDRPVAIKLLPPTLAAQPELRDRFLREARAAASLAHPNIVPVHAAGERGGLAYFGYSYYVENKNRLKLLGVNAGSGCKTPNVDRIQNRAYKPLSRPLFVYVKRDSFRKPVVAAFMRYIIVNESKIARSAKMVPLTKKQIAKAKRQYNTAIRNR
jgi:serine/threonine protein kinase